MKKNIYLYLFVFSALLFLFQWVSSSRRFSAMDQILQDQEKKINSYQDSIAGLEERLDQLNYFTLEQNEEALSYYDHLEIGNLEELVQEQLMMTNQDSGSNPLVPFEGMAGDFKINKVQVINHKFVLADFSDGTYWGDMILRYEIEDNLRVSFEVVDQLLYPQP